MHPIPRLVIAAMLCTSVIACSKKVKETPPPPATDTGTGTTTGGVGGTGGTTGGCTATTDERKYQLFSVPAVTPPLNSRYS